MRSPQVSNAQSDVTNEQNPHNETFLEMMGLLPGRHKKGNKSLIKRIKSPCIKYGQNTHWMNEMGEIF